MNNPPPITSTPVTSPDPLPPTPPLEQVVYALDSKGRVELYRSLTSLGFRYKSNGDALLQEAHSIIASGRTNLLKLLATMEQDHKALMALRDALLNTPHSSTTTTHHS